jgi:hypothetical protein
VKDLEYNKQKFPNIGRLRQVAVQDKDEKKVKLGTELRRQVYERAKKRCECCGKPLKISQGEFHHLRKPCTDANPLTIQFLCNAHHKLGHERKIKVKQTLSGIQTKTIIKRKRVRKHPSAIHWKNEKPLKKKR